MERRGLGRGLGALISSTRADGESATIREVPVDQIDPNPYQPRNSFDEEKLEEMAQSIREHGVLQPVILRRTGAESYELVVGERRLRAARSAGLDSIPAVIKEYAHPQMLEVALIENLQREDINPVDAAVAYRRLRDEFGVSQEEISRRVGKAPSTIANTLRLLALPSPVLESLGRGEITEGHARALLQARPEAQFTAWQDVVRRGLSVRETERLARDLKIPSSDGGGKAPRVDVRERDPNMAAIEEALQTVLGTKVTIRRSGRTGRIEIEFYSDEELEGIVGRLMQ